MSKLSDRALREEFEQAMHPWYRWAVDTGRIVEKKYLMSAPGLGLFAIECNATAGYRYSDPDVEIQFQAFAQGYQRATTACQLAAAMDSVQKYLNKHPPGG